MPITAQGNYVIMVGLAESLGANAASPRKIDFKIEDIEVRQDINIFLIVGACRARELYFQFSINASGKITVGSDNNITPNVANTVELKIKQNTREGMVSFVVVIKGDCSAAN